MNIINTLLEITVYSAILFAAIWLFRILLKKHLSSAMMYAMWFLLIARLLLPVTISAGFSLFVVPAAETAGLPYQSEDITDRPGGETMDGYAFGQSGLSGDAEDTSLFREQTAADTTSVQPVQRDSHVSITWEAALTAIWIAGALSMLAAVFVSKKKLKKRLKSANTIPKEWQQLADEIKIQLAIKRNIRIVMIKGFPSPALTANIRPTVVIPEELLFKSEESVRFALLHEMTHIKRKDNLISMLLLVLRAVYWFNPIVWLTVKQMHLDMESACDSTLTNPMSMQTKKRYAGTMLSMYAEKQVRYVLGMATGQTKKTAEKRLLGIFMRNKTSQKGKAAALLLACVLLVACFTTACQPTPEKPFVQSKDNDTVADVIDEYQSQDSKPEIINTFSAPETWQSETHDEVKKIDLYVDAAVNVPTDTWGLYELRPIEPTLEDVQKILNAVVGDSTIYGEQTVRSKEYLLEKITHLEAQKEEFERLLNEGGLSEDEKLAQEAENLIKGTPGPIGENGEPESAIRLTKEELQQNIDNYTAMINEAKALLPTAPDEDTVVKHEFVPADMFRTDLTKELAQQSGFSYQQEGGSVAMSLNGTADTGKQNPADIYIGLYRGDYNHFSLNFADYDDYEHSFTANDVAYTGQELFKCDIGVEEAAQIARDKVAEMGYGYLDIDSTFVSEMLDRKRMEGDDYPECFEFIFTRKLDGVTVTNAHGDGICTEEKDLALQYAPHWGADEVKVYVDDSGIVGVRVGTLKSEAVRQAYGIELKDLEEIMGIFETQLFIKNAYSGPGDNSQVIGREIHVTEIRLGYMPTAWKDHSGQIIFVPVWDFFGEEVVTFEEGIGGDLGESLDENNKYYRNLGTESLLTINALDGTIMVRQ